MLHLVGILFLHINDDAQSESLQIWVCDICSIDSIKNNETFQGLGFFYPQTKGWWMGGRGMVSTQLCPVTRTIHYHWTICFTAVSVLVWHVPVHLQHQQQIVYAATNTQCSQKRL